MTILDNSLEDLERISLYFSVFRFPIFKGFEARFLLVLHWRIGASGGYCIYSKNDVSAFGLEPDIVLYFQSSLL